MVEIPLFAKTAVLDTYLGLNPLSLPGDTVSTIAKSLGNNNELYSYFFRHRPRAEWATILEPLGYFEMSP